jgi:transposase-like protein
MKHLSLQAREAIVEKALKSNGQSLTEIANSNNIGYSTLQRWLKDYRNKAQSSSSRSVCSKAQVSPAERFQHLTSTSNLDSSALGAYCRENGLYSFQLKQWKEEFMKKIRIKNHNKA